jgi:hypothetical protein
VEVYGQPSREGYLEKRVVGPEATLVSASVPGIEIRVADLVA